MVTNPSTHPRASKTPHGVTLGVRLADAVTLPGAVWLADEEEEGLQLPLGVAAAVGLVVNAASREPLPWNYSTLPY